MKFDGIAAADLRGRANRVERVDKAVAERVVLARLAEVVEPAVRLSAEIRGDDSAADD